MDLFPGIITWAVGTGLYTLSQKILGALWESNNYLTSFLIMQTLKKQSQTSIFYYLMYLNLIKQVISTARISACAMVLYFKRGTALPLPAQNLFLPSRLGLANVSH